MKREDYDKMCAENALVVGDITYLYWRPIEKAPKDGSAILAWNGGDMSVVRWSRGAYCSPSYDDWRIQGAREEEEMDPTPTHWMPLPELPT